MVYSIYKITNTVNGKVYIGFTENVERRWRQHKNLSSTGKKPLYQAFRKYGIEKFDFEIIFESENRELTLLEMEPKFIVEYDSIHNGYNLQSGGTNTNTTSMKELNRKRMLENNPMKNEETKAKNTGCYVKGQKPTITEERNRKIRESKLGEKNPNFGNPDAAKVLNIYVTCEKCGVVMNKGNYNRWHKKRCDAP